MRRIGLMGGSFNPIHLAHVSLAQNALDGGYVDEVVFLPTGNPPHKREGLADKEDRLAMVCLAIEGRAHMRASREEIDRPGVIYTVDTLRRLGEQMAGCRLLYLIGADTLFQLSTWRSIGEVIKLCGFLVCMRPGEPRESVLALAQQWRARGAQIRLMNAEELPLSSTQVRQRLCRGMPVDGMLDPAVERYIRAHALYGTGRQKQDGSNETRENAL